MKKLMLLLLTTAIFQTIAAQNDYNRVNFYPPSVASMMKYIDYPVSPRTGIPDIAIPLFEIRSGKLELPLTLSFHIDDYAKVNQQPGAAGAGWALSADIQVSRSINGLDDFSAYGYLQIGKYKPDYNGTVATPSQNELYYMYKGEKDEEPDKFYYKLLGKSGAFYFMRQANGSVVTKQVPMNGVQIVYTPGNSQTTFKAIDTDGTVYRFSSQKKDTNSPVSGTAQDMAWKCDKIISASGADTIFFEYVNCSKTVKKYDAKEEVYDRIRIFDSGAPTALCDAVRGPKYLVYGSTYGSRMHYVGINEDGGYSFDWQAMGDIQNPPRSQSLKINTVSKIKFKSGWVEFAYTGNEILTQIKLYAKAQATPVRTVVLGQDGTGYARTLKNLTVGKDLYSFSYSDTHKGETFQDFWGYSGSSCGIPYMNLSVEPGADGLTSNNAYFPEEIGSVDLGVGSQNIYYASSNVRPFITIKYPTGGSVVFSCDQQLYRSTDGVYNDNVVVTSAPRIKQIEYRDADNTILKQKIYKYGPNEAGYGVIRREPKLFSDYGTTYTEQSLHYYYYSGYTGLTRGAVARLRTFLPGTIFNMNYSDGTTVNYEEVAEYEKDMGTETGKTVYKYALENRYGFINHHADPESPYPIGDDAWWVATPDSVIYYKYQDGEYDWVKKTGYRYECYMEPDRIFQGRVWTSVLPVLVGGSPVSLGVNHYNFSYRTSAIQVGCMQLAQQDDYVKNDDGSILATQTKFYYDSPNRYTPNRKVTTYPGGEVVTEQSLFPEDYAASDSYTKELRASNLVSLPLERIVRKNGKVVSGESFKYDFVGRLLNAYRLEALNLSESAFRLSNKSTAGNLNAPGSAAYSLDSHYNKRATLLYDAEDNICEVSAPGKASVCYLWGYTGQHLVEEIRNATYAQVRSRLGDALLTRVLKSVVPSSSDLTQINNLRNDKTLLVTTATYLPLYGMQSQTDPDGVTESYEYNPTTGRLLKVIDCDGRTNTEYSYSLDQ